MVQNAFARTVTRSPQSIPASELLSNLHWLPINKRVNCHSDLKGTVYRTTSLSVQFNFLSPCENARLGLFSYRLLQQNIQAVLYTKTAILFQFLPRISEFLTRNYAAFNFLPVFSVGGRRKVPVATIVSDLCRCLSSSHWNSIPPLLTL